MSSRTDSDSLGKVKIPADGYYGPFTGRAIKQYHVTGTKSHLNLVKSFVMIKRSAALANMKTGAIDKKRGGAIVQACDKVLAGKYLDQFVVDAINSGAGTAFNMNTNEVIANVALQILHKKKGQYQFLHPNDHVNMSQSSNDTFPTAMHVAILMNLRKVLPAIGPEAINLISFASLLISSAKFLRADETFATANLLCKAYCISGSGLSGNFEIFAS